MSITASDAILRMEAMLHRAEDELRCFSDEEAAEFALLKITALLKGPPVETTAPILDKPAGQLRPVAGATRSLTDSVRADGLFARMGQSGRARLDIPIDVRALGSTQADNPQPGLTVAPVSFGPISTYHGIVNRLLSALASIPVTGTNAITYTRLSYAPDVGSPSQTGNAARKVQELAPKPESELATEDVTQVLNTYAHWIPCSKQVLDDVTGLRALLDNTLVNGLLDKTDTAIYADMTAAGRFVPFVPVGANVADNLARVAALLLMAGATGVKIALNPMTMLAMGLAKATGSGEYLGLPPNIPATLVSSASVPLGKILAWADSGAIWANREGVSVVAGWANDDFTSNRISLLAEHRGALLTLDPAHVYYGSAA